MIKKWLMTVVIIVMILLWSSLSGQQAEANAGEIQVYFEGERLIFEDANPVMIDTRTMVPFRTIFESLGFEVMWIGGEVRQAIGKKDGLAIELTIDHRTARVNDQAVELDVPAQIWQSSTLVPLRFVSENSGYHVYFSNSSGIAVVGIGRTAETANPGIIQPTHLEEAVETSTPATMGSVESYVIKGRVVDLTGNPVAGVNVYAYNTLISSSYIGSITDNEGYYRIELPQITTSYTMYATDEVQYGGKHYILNPLVNNESFIASRHGAIRNFVWDINVGRLDVFALDDGYPHDVNAPKLKYDDIEITLEPVGLLLNGSMGTKIVDVVPNLEKDIPVGVYKITAVWKPQDYQPVDFLITDRSDYAESLTIAFDESFNLSLTVMFPE